MVFSPVIAKINGSEAVVFGLGTKVYAYSATTGSPLWGGGRQLSSRISAPSIGSSVIFT